MTTKLRLSASVDAALLEGAIAAAAGGAASSLSAWVNDALRLKLEHDSRLAAMSAFITDYERDHGEITVVEIERATRNAKSRALIVRGSKNAR